MSCEKVPEQVKQEPLKEASPSFKKLKANYKEYKQQVYFRGNDSFFELKNYDFGSILDTIYKTHPHIFKKSTNLDGLKNQVKLWLRDSIFIEPSKQHQLEFFSGENKTQLHDDHYSDSLKPYQYTPKKMFRVVNARAAAMKYEDKKVYYQFYPKKVKILDKSTEMYKVQRTGRYLFDAENGNDCADTCSRASLYLMDTYIADIYIIISPYKNSPYRPTIKITDTINYFYNRFVKQD
ncbi:MAG: hypothetical protein AB8B65_10805 [Kordia sp.]|uniref:hypothetical protein n=1 Tax=Kordia sp. TaxID=1965332 RepID=UPI00385943A3